MKRKYKTWQKYLIWILLYCITIGIVSYMAYQYGCSFKKIFILDIVVSACYMTSVFSYAKANVYDELNFNNKLYPIRFLATYFISLCVSVVFPIFPSKSWFFPVIALALALFSNSVTGIIVFTQMLSISSILAGVDIVLVILYLLTGIICIILFEKMDHTFKIGFPFFISNTIYCMGIIGYTFFEMGTKIDYEAILIPVINVFLTALIMLAVLRVVCATIIDKEKGEYLDINDQEFSLLVKYKESDPEIYYDAIHTAYFTEKIARVRGMDIDLAKNGGYYHRIIANECKQQNKSLEAVCDQYQFPDKAVTLLQEINYKSKEIVGRETAVVYLVEAVVSSILFLMKKEEQKEVDYGKVAVGIIRRRVESGVLKNSDISFNDIREMENIFLGEKLYYDFLRRE